MRFLLPLLFCLSCWAQPDQVWKKLLAVTAASTSPTTPDQIPGIVAWYDVTNSFKLNGAATTANTEIAQIKDRYGGLNLTNAGDGNHYATNRATGPNGSNWMQITLDGSGFSPCAYTNMGTFPNCASNFTIWAVMEIFHTASFNNKRLEFAGTATGFQYLNYVPNQALGLNGGGTSFGPQTILENSWITVITVSSPTNIIIYTNNVQYFNNGGAIGTLSNLFSMGTKSGNNCNGGFVEWAVYSNSLDSANRTVLQTYSHNKYGL